MGLFISSSCFFANAAEEKPFVMQFVYEGTGMKENAHELFKKAVSESEGKGVNVDFLTKDSIADVNYSINFYCVMKNLFKKIGCWDENIKTGLLYLFNKAKPEGRICLCFSDDLKKKIEDVLKSKEEYKKIDVTESDLTSAKEEINSFMKRELKYSEEQSEIFRDAIKNVNSFKNYKKKELQQRIESLYGVAEKDEEVKKINKEIKDLDDEKKLNELYEKEKEEIQASINGSVDKLKFYGEILKKIKSIELKNVEGLNQNLEINNELLKVKI